MTANREETPVNEHISPSSYRPFHGLMPETGEWSEKRMAIAHAWALPEPELVPKLLARARVPDEVNKGVHDLAYSLSSALRGNKGSADRASLVQNLLQEYSLSSQEGIALMCLAEALLRIPDADTRDLLIRDKLVGRDWKRHLGGSRSLLVNAATWGLLITGSLVRPGDRGKVAYGMKKIIKTGSAPLIRKAMTVAMHIMSEHFVTGEKITQALEQAEKIEAQGFTYTYDMLGEAALTGGDAENYIARCQSALHAIGRHAKGKGIYAGAEFSLKLSALHPRYSLHQYDRVLNEVYPALKSLVLLAHSYDVAITIDAEETERLDISLDLLARLCGEPELASWNGIGFVVQAYQKRCSYVIDYLTDLAKKHQRRLRVRLVKGAYWDSEIKRAQIAGHSDYPVFTRKVYTDISYLACARALLAEPEYIYPQFATHNARTLAAVYHLAGSRYVADQYEFQCLHGMGVPLYQHVVGKDKLDRPCRIYAPVGTHETLLPYLVRRLLENGSNSSFVNQIADPAISIESLIADPVAEVEALGVTEHGIGSSHPGIPLPGNIYGDGRKNSAGLNLYNEDCLRELSAVLPDSSREPVAAAPIIAGEADPAAPRAVVNPAEPRDIVGYVHEAADGDIALSLAAAEKAAGRWAAESPSRRADILLRAAALLEQNMAPLIGVLVREAGKTFNNAVAEVREAVDFLNYYAVQVKTTFDNATHVPLGTVVCISPWNFPLAIFTGQIAAALAAGNTVIAKPAEQTPLVAGLAVKLLLEAGIPHDVLQMLPGLGETVGQTLVADARVKGVMFTGSTAVASIIQRKIADRLDAAGRPVPLIAETGGINAMIVDSSALPEQVIIDCINSAFDSAGQRCSALRLLCVQQDIADTLLEALRGAMIEYRLGNPEHLSTDIGPVIDAEAKDGIDAHIRRMTDKGLKVYQAAYGEPQARDGYFVTPALIELNDIRELDREVFGPVLHVLRYESGELPALIERINDLGYGLTFGIHSRIDHTVRQVTESVEAGNLYVNRNMVGAVVGVQPFGGEGLSGTGPKAGGPLYLYRLLAERPADAPWRGLRYTAAAEPEALPDRAGLLAAHEALSAWAAQRHPDIHTLCLRFRADSASATLCYLPGPTGEENTYRLLPRERVLALAEDPQDLLVQLAAIASVGCRVLWPDAPQYLEAYQQLPETVRRCVDIAPRDSLMTQRLDAVIHHGDTDALRALCQQVAERQGAIVSVQGFARGETDIRLERLLLERSLSVNTAAAGGNTHLMTI
ncbi:trifunctional transcriptional regulator/proline dehydrogenase/L-glutamate gamma-semialdehyde dehydrogenase [Brenneria goodwinii]|uniref:Bifunctional protein PutA n=1 Tax=Brenneria goodwinii TaxID=1109412 RepID=A0AAE8ETV2_9GAMM|nr:trifunctional transcriptional regulator/proline dehydrogenase/L-glutamate gamma-semialdehyde dehydrogenase [Brenneria goodwinii]ATA26326.1 trifunctional transcriptional regulator/proline dehydrogenase/L-glutamate gamma-semialdehyde dehydrogenase [Brenneria goodwinii]RLM28793.1 trifunctional transcriptional regulator/proline dehydrogenase/L-glutamate gamma-semialdehyde dehydrogenase [Brenneria goodwinii]